MLPEAWLPPAQIQELRDKTRLRKRLAEDRSRWAQRLHAILPHEGCSCSRGRLLSTKGQRWLDGLALDRHVRALIDAHVAMIDATTQQMAELELQLRQLARSDRRLVALQQIYGVGPVVACHLLAEIGAARRFRRAEQIVRLSGLDPVVLESADSKRRGKLSKQGSPHLRWALVQAAQHAARRPGSSPDGDNYLALRERVGSQRAALSTARKIAKRAHHVLAALEDAA